MNKLTKGALAATAAGALLLGGVGTFALWEDNQSIAAESISTGQLDMSVGSGTWVDVSTGSTILSIDGFNVVPGDTLTHTVPVSITAEGDNLAGELAVTQASIENALGADWAPYVTVTTETVLPAGSAITPDPINPDLLAFASEGTHTLDVVITVTFSSDAPDQVGQNTSLNLSALALSLTQA
ncbi:hypothetical protein D477_010331 [Arthrobacter crystallopoietes BAB-32]|uniref:Alternate-type signal peptide domain-containing protein n=1 Tax=Arthrobacter crystallopoietes BAB-32 TaxID=1246476 RepID=N1V2M7_9MICC|nr:alternate-type signal peptide domain-containing protein [Arthrobacter crystallopoietes]EMY34292.1 hypothetical protein D477_010331 [Arthrobacter crystallopoietes BAB-32]